MTFVCFMSPSLIPDRLDKPQDVIFGGGKDIGIPPKIILLSIFLLRLADGPIQIKIKESWASSLKTEVTSYRDQKLLSLVARISAHLHL